MSKDLIALSGSFISRNILKILLITILFIIFTIIIMANNIKFDKKKTVLDKVIIIEKFTPNNLNLAKNNKIKPLKNNFNIN
tara:strand:- start:1555 stop:1797 length:243 start_codon:yes stop_codon:yes gene_type:complete